MMENLIKSYMDQRSAIIDAISRLDINSTNYNMAYLNYSNELANINLEIRNLIIIGTT